LEFVGYGKTRSSYAEVINLSYDYKHRAGVIWRLAECCVRYDIQQEQFFNALCAAVRKQESKKPVPAQKDIVAALIGLQLSSSQVLLISCI
jgi:hypothetical protein